ncbi:MAG: hypothetical protein LDL31_08355 [Prosthecobacter sp.]|nr:hypothetical protein [Prosthecobacter sp.]
MDPETAAVLAERLSETLPADMPLEQLRERVMEEFTAAGGTLPGSVPRRYVEDARAYEATGYPPQEAAMHAANAKAANEQDVAAAHEKNRKLREALSRPRVRMSHKGRATTPVERLAAWWREYAKAASRSHRRGVAPAENVRDFAAIAEHYAAGEDVTVQSVSFHQFVDGMIRSWQMSFKEPGGKQLYAYIYESRDGFVHVDTSGMKSTTKARGGDLVYQTALTYAHNNHLLFRPDPQSVSEIAHQRRLGHLLSSALRHGTTRHIYPYHLTRPEFNDVPQGSWSFIQDGFADNVALLARLEAEGVQKIARAVGEDITGLHYDSESDTIQDDSGRSLLNSDVTDILGKLDPAASGVGETAFLRTMVSQGALQGQNSAGNPVLREIVGDLYASGRGALVSGDDIRRSPRSVYRVGFKDRSNSLLYSRPAVRSGGSLNPQSRAKLAQSGVNLLRQNAPEIARGIRLVPNRDALNEADFHPDDWAGMAETEGFFDPRTGLTVIFTDQVEIREGETMPRAVVRVAIHERIGHAGLEALRQADASFARRWAALVESIENDPTLSAEVAAIAEQPGYEHLADDPAGLVEEWFARRVEAMSDAELKALKPTSALGRLWQALKDLLNRWTGRFARSEWTVRELREIMALSKQALRDGWPVGVEGDGRVRQSRKFNPFHSSDAPNWLKKPFKIPSKAPFRVQALGFRARRAGDSPPYRFLARDIARLAGAF